MQNLYYLLKIKQISHFKRREFDFMNELFQSKIFIFTKGHLYLRVIRYFTKRIEKFLRSQKLRTYETENLFYEIFTFLKVKEYLKVKKFFCKIK